MIQNLSVHRNMTVHADYRWLNAAKASMPVSSVIITPNLTQPQLVLSNFGSEPATRRYIFVLYLTRRIDLKTAQPKRCANNGPLWDENGPRLWGADPAIPTTSRTPGAVLSLFSAALFIHYGGFTGRRAAFIGTAACKIGGSRQRD